MSSILLTICMPWPRLPSVGLQIHIMSSFPSLFQWLINCLYSFGSTNVNGVKSYILPYSYFIFFMILAKLPLVHILPVWGMCINFWYVCPLLKSPSEGLKYWKTKRVNAQKWKSLLTFDSSRVYSIDQHHVLFRPILWSPSLQVCAVPHLVLIFLFCIWVCWSNLDFHTTLIGNPHYRYGCYSK